MTRPGFAAVAVILLGFAAPSAPLWAAEPGRDGADFKEVYELVQQHLAGVTPAELNRTAVQSLVSALSPRVSLVGAEEAAATNTPAVASSNLFDGGIVYVRVRRVNAELAPSMRAACQKLSSGTNRLKGVALDLRFAGGNDYAGAAAAAELFLKKEKPLLDWGNGVIRSVGNPEAVAAPVAVLVNHETAGAAEALAAVLRETGTGLLLGSRTAGQAAIAKEYPLKNGERLRIATGPVRLADGSALPPTGVIPDIAVEVDPAQERAWYANAFRDFANTNLQAAADSETGLAPGSTNRSRRIRFNEAELVRERRDGLNSDLETDGPNELEKPVVRDPTLARALDVLKGLAVVRESRF